MNSHQNAILENVFSWGFKMTLKFDWKRLFKFYSILIFLFSFFWRIESFKTHLDETWIPDVLISALQIDILFQETFSFKKYSRNVAFTDYLGPFEFKNFPRPLASIMVGPAGDSKLSAFRNMCFSKLSHFGNRGAIPVSVLDIS